MTGRRARAVVTGLGTVGAAGCGAGALAAALTAATPSTRAVDLSDGYHRPGTARTASLAAGLDLSPWLSPLAARRMSWPSKFAVVAAKQALEAAGVELDKKQPNPLAIILGTSFGATSVTEGILRQILDEGPEAVSPALFTESVANAAAAQVALAVKAVGANVTVTQREASGLLALARAAREVASGRAPLALAGCVDEINPLLHAILGRFGSLATGRGDGVETARPFDLERDGTIAAEGATVLAVESEEHARARGATVVAVIEHAVSGFDPRAPVTGWSRDGDLLAERLRAGLEAGGIEVASIDRIVSGAAGSRDGDRLEALTLRAAWSGRPLPPVLAPKGVTGEYGGGFLAAALLAAGGHAFGPTAGFRRPDPELGVTPHDGSELAPPSRLLISSLAAGGAATWLVLGAGETA